MTAAESNPLVPLRRSAALSALVVMLALLAGSMVAVRGLSLEPWFVARATALYLLALVALARVLPRHLPNTRLGPASQVTLWRLGLTMLLAGCLGETGEQVAWLALCVASLVLMLDGLDGWLARRGGWVSPFGARFDMETDALLIALLAILVWQLDKAGAWIMLSGCMRYLYLAAACLWPWLREPLPASRRRQRVCVLQVLSLLLALAPPVPPTWSGALAGCGLLLLCYSFAVDITWARAHSQQPLKEALHEEL